LTLTETLDLKIDQEQWKPFFKRIAAKLLASAADDDDDDAAAAAAEDGDDDMT